MPYVPPHLRTTAFYEDKKVGPRIATTLAEAGEMSKAALSEAPKSALASMLSAPKPKKAIAAAKRDKRPIHIPNATTIAAIQESRSIQTNAAKIAADKLPKPAPAKPPIAAGSFGSMLPPVLSPKPVKVRPPKVAAPVTTPANPEVLKVASLTTDPAFESALDDILRTIFEDSMHKVKRVGSAHALNFERRANGSYKNERLESRYQGFKLQKLEEVAGDVSDKLEQILRSRFEIAMSSVKRIATAKVGDFSRRANGSYRNERLESRFQGYLMGAVNDFGRSVLMKIADNRVAALKAVR